MSTLTIFCTLRDPRASQIARLQQILQLILRQNLNPTTCSISAVALALYFGCAW